MAIPFVFAGKADSVFPVFWARKLARRLKSQVWGANVAGGCGGTTAVGCYLEDCVYILENKKGHWVPVSPQNGSLHQSRFRAGFLSIFLSAFDHIPLCSGEEANPRCSLC